MVSSIKSSVAPTGESDLRKISIRYHPLRCGIGSAERKATTDPFSSTKKYFLSSKRVQGSTRLRKPRVAILRELSHSVTTLSISFRCAEESSCRRNSITFAPFLANRLAGGKTSNQSLSFRYWLN